MKSDQASNTAYWVALGCLVVFNEDQRLHWDSRIAELLRIFLRNGPVPFSIGAQLANSSFGRLSLEKAMSTVIPGMFLHYVARKKALEKWVRLQIESGCEQIVIVAGGFDTLGLRLSEDFPTLRVFELDHPATQKRKTDSLLRKKHSVTFVQADLSTISVENALRGTHFRAQLRTTFIFEGVFMYLSGKQVEETLRHLSQAFRNSSLAFTFLDQLEGKKIGFKGGSNGFVNWFLDRTNEPFLWEIPKSQIQQFTRALGWSSEKTLDHEDLFLEFVPRGFQPPAEGECLQFCFL